MKRAAASIGPSAALQLNTTPLCSRALLEGRGLVVLDRDEYDVQPSDASARA